ncbi:MAG: plasmid partitioning protein RepB C-terminal domain-containing protein [Armatimonadota bacterium]
MDEAHAAEPKLSFEMSGKWLPLADMLPSRRPDGKLTGSRKYATVLASIREVGVIEPLVVHPLGAAAEGKYLLLDGHLRLEALKELGQERAPCLIATDDETYTYNAKVNQVSAIQEHFMILKALERGVSEARIANALKVDVKRIREKRDLLQGVCPEAVALLKDASAPAAAIQKLKRVKPPRQVEIVEMMLLVNNFSSVYCEALVAATPKALLADNGKAKKHPALRPEDIARMEREMETLQRDLQAHEDSYGENFLHLVVVRGYLSRLLENERVVRFVSQHSPDVLTAFQQIVESTSLEG